MEANYKLYWIKYSEFTDPYKDGYIGITYQTLETRYKEKISSLIKEALKIKKAKKCGLQQLNIDHNQINWKCSVCGYHTTTAFTNDSETECEPRCVRNLSK